MRLSIVQSAAFLFSTFLAAPALSAECGIPASGALDWEAANAATLGIDKTKLCKLELELSSRSDSTIHSVLIAREGKLVFEWYGTGRDWPWGKEPGQYRYDIDTPHDVRSISKSVTSLLVGIAVDRRLIRGVDDSIFEYLPQYADLKTPENGTVTVADLLTMTSGFVANEDVAYDDPNNTERLMAQSPDPYRFVLERKLESKPGTTFLYNGGNTMLLSAILQNATKKAFLEFAREQLFEPLGISKFDWIPLRANGQTAAYGSLRLRPRDLAKIGQLVLNGGVWEGRQIVSRDWIDQSVRPRVDGWFPDQYGYQWWVGRAETGVSPVDWIAGVGLGGQRVFIAPKLRLVVTINGWMGNDQRRVARELFEARILPAITN